MAGNYKDLVVWQKAMDLTIAVYTVTRHFPVDERFGLTNQLRRAAVSVASNIAEGQGRKSKADFQRFLRIANGSRQEVETQLLTAVRLGFLDDNDMADFTSRLDEIGRLLNGLIRSIA